MKSSIAKLITIRSLPAFDLTLRSCNRRAVMHFLSSFGALNYVCPGQSRLWVFSYIFFGWMEVCGTCMLIAERILARPVRTCDATCLVVARAGTSLTASSTPALSVAFVKRCPDPVE